MKLWPVYKQNLIRDDRMVAIIIELIECVLDDCTDGFVGQQLLRAKEDLKAARDDVARQLGSGPCVSHLGNPHADRR